MATTAKVLCYSKTLSSHQTSVRFMADYQDGRNKEWASATPALDFNITLRPDVADRFDLGNGYLVTFEEAE